MEKVFVGEELLWETLGNIFIIAAFVGAIFSSISYYFAHKENDLNWKRLARIGFNIHSVGVLGIIAVLFYLLFNHRFEYHYVWQHSNTAMPMQYILSCFWEGQEGSFLLWTFWNMVLGNILIRTSKSWEFTTMAIVALVQVFLSSMLLGIYIGEIHLGSNPFLLLREHPDFVNLPFVQSTTYLEKLDGRGLNPLLQNYWMTIHPPTLFLGFAATLFPFAYAVAGIWQKKYSEWINPALKWTFFGISILGTGVLMGGAWAYESLSFGGFWAWDPVENASLVPWITFVAGGHVMLINKNKGQSITTAFFLIFITFILILYSTFLTRSGILGDTSVHAFTDLGMSGQLLIYLLFFMWLPAAISIPKGTFKVIYLTLSFSLLVFSLFTGFYKLTTVLFIAASLGLMLYNISKATQTKEEEENLSSREFWMFVSALVLLIAAFQITFSTSTPVINKFLSGNVSMFFGWLNGIMPTSLFEKLAEAKLATPKDVIGHYNAWQIPFAIITGLLIAVGHFLKYKKTNTAELIKRIWLSVAISLVLTLVLSLFLEIDNTLLILLLFASLFATIANIDYLFRILKGKLNRAGSSIAHIGFGMILLGSLISAGKKEVISQNNSKFDLGKDFPNKENILLSRRDTVKMGDYYVSYRGDSTSGINVYYNVDYLQKDESGSIKKQFTLHPFIQTNPRMGNVAEPATKHYLHKDVFTHITYAKMEDPKEKKNGGWEEAQDYQLSIGDTIFTSNAMVILGGVNRNVDKLKNKLQETDIAIGAQLNVLSMSSEKDIVEPVFVIRGLTSFAIDTILQAKGLQFSLWKIDPEKEAFHIRIREKASNAGDFIIMKAIIFPGINILWIGSILMAIGTILAVWSRVKLPSNAKTTA